MDILIRTGVRKNFLTPLYLLTVIFTVLSCFFALFMICFVFRFKEVLPKAILNMFAYENTYDIYVTSFPSLSELKNMDFENIALNLLSSKIIFTLASVPLVFMFTGMYRYYDIFIYKAKGFKPREILFSQYILSFLHIFFVSCIYLGTLLLFLPLFGVDMSVSDTDRLVQTIFLQEILLFNFASIIIALCNVLKRAIPSVFAVLSMIYALPIVFVFAKNLFNVSIPFERIWILSISYYAGKTPITFQSIFMCVCWAALSVAVSFYTLNKLSFSDTTKKGVF